jgi:hypothetical protein
MAHFVIDYGPETDLLWVVFMDQDGACWSVPNPEVRMRFNWSMGRRKPNLKPAERAAVRVFPRPAEYRAWLLS